MFNIRKILVPVDFSPGSKNALEHALVLTQTLGAELHVLHVWEPPRFEGREPQINVQGAPGTLSEYALDLARREMEGFLASLSPEQHGHVHSKVEAGRPRERILETASQGAFDLVVMGTHGRTGRARSLAGSVTESIVRTSPTPVLTVRERE